MSDVIYWGEIEKRGNSWSVGLRNSLGGGSFSTGEPTKEWALYRLMAKSHVRDECQPRYFIINGKRLSRDEAKTLIRKDYILERI